MKQIIILFLFLVFGSKFFNYVNWNLTIAGQLSYFIYAILIVYIYKYKNKIKRYKTPIDSWIIKLMIIPLLCIITRILIEGSSLYEQRTLIVLVLTFGFYYYFKISQISEKKIIRLFTIYGICVLIIQIIQQFIPDRAVFGVASPESDQFLWYGLAEKRNGIYRYRIDAIPITLFCMYYYWTKLCNKMNIINFLLFICFFTSMYLFLTRQVIFASIICLATSFLFIKNTKMKIWVIFITSIIGYVILTNADILFGKLLEQTQEDATEDNIRLLEITFFWNKIIDNPLSFLFGNGYPQILTYWGERYRMYNTDIGFIGAMYNHGIFWPLFYFYVVYKLLFKYGKELPLYIKLFVFGTAINSILIFPWRQTEEFFLWSAILYIVSLYLTKHNKLIV